MTNSHIAACLVVYALTVLGLCVYIKQERAMIRMDNSIYVQTGLMEYDDKGTKIYVPVYMKKE